MPEIIKQRQHYYIIETEFENNTSYLYSIYNKHIDEHYKADFSNPDTEKKLFEEAENLLKDLSISEDELLRISKFFDNYSIVICLIHLNDPIQASFKKLTEINDKFKLVFTYEIIDSTIERILELKYDTKISSFCNIGILVLNTSIEYYNVLSNLNKSKFTDLQFITILKPIFTEKGLKNSYDYIFYNGFYKKFEKSKFTNNIAFLID